MLDYQPLSLETLGDGGAVELFNAELDRAIQNIADINSDPKAVRKVTLEVSLKPNEAGDFAVIEYKVNGKYPGFKPQSTSVHLVQTANGLVATEFNPKQARLEFKKEESVNV
jgi:hypothetical protein